MAPEAAAPTFFILDKRKLRFREVELLAKATQPGSGMARICTRVNLVVVLLTLVWFTVALMGLPWQRTPVGRMWGSWIAENPVQGCLPFGTF